ncbi:MAG: hydrogenase iron-sulfur subunit [Acidobacteria bacterium]|nr:hydrogenase iron-sulfur subunit [Acidobacteriota bacterium]
MDKKLGVYICSGCSIGDSLDTGSLVKIAEGEGKAACCRVHPFLCSREGVDWIRKDLEDDTADAVVIAACSPRVKTDAFAFDPFTVMERVNLREHVAWCQKPRDEDTQMMAEDYLRMGIAKARKMEKLIPVSETISKKILVVGGGVTGMTAAKESADAGYEVLLVEREASLGGYVAGVKSRFPGHPPYAETIHEGIRDTIDAVLYHSKIQVLTSAHIDKIQGQPGMFDVEIEVGGSIVRDRVGAIVQATGWKPYDPSKLGHLGYGSSPDIVTNIEFEEMAAKGRIFRPSDGKPVGSVLFIQCAGSRDKAHLPYCSSVCCMTTLKQAGYIREQNPDAKIYVVYKDIRTPGQYEKYYKAAQEDPLTFFTKGEVVSVEKKSPIGLAATVADTLLGGDIEIKADLVVLAAGMVPNSADGEAIRALEDAELKARTSDSEKQRAEAARKAEELRRHKGTEILNLAYRQGPDLPALRYGFPDSHFICFPYETRRTAIYTAGAVRAPMDSAYAMEDALGAAMKSIQSVELAAQGQAVHPRAGDMSFPDFFLQRCTQCKRCTEECPFGAIDEDEKGTPRPNPYRCRRCGVCLGACPERIISFKNYSVDMIASMIKAIGIPEEEEEKPRILVFMCENDAYPALDIAGLRRLKYDASVRVIPLRCLGSMNIVWIADALSRGFDGILLIGCKFGDDYQCHFIKGSELADRRMENVKETLQRLQLESERLRLTQLSINEPDKLANLINEFADQIREIGPNPYKDM